MSLHCSDGYWANIQVEYAWLWPNFDSYSVDKDDDDEITKDDWYQALLTTGAKVTMYVIINQQVPSHLRSHWFREDVEKMFSELDKDFDGKLSWREFIGEETTTERAFKLFDENHDGKISKSVRKHHKYKYHFNF